MKLFSVLLAVVTLLAVAPAAKANSFAYDFVAVNSPPVSGVFTVYTTALGSVTGGVLDITGLGDPYFHAGDYTSEGGILSGGFGSVLFQDGSFTITLTDSNGVWSIYNNDNTNERLTIGAETPEPSSLLLLGTGLSLLAGGLFWTSRARTRIATRPQANFNQAI